MVGYDKALEVVERGTRGLAGVGIKARHGVRVDTIHAGRAM